MSTEKELLSPIKRRNFSNMYDKILSDKVNVKIIDRDYSSIVPHIYPIRINKTINRDNIRKTLISKGIQTGVHYFPNHLLTKYRSKNFTSLPITEEIFPELLTLPLHPDLNENDIVFVCNELLNAINQEI